MSAIKSAVVIGGGVAGPVVGMALQKAGISATIYEAYPSTAAGIGVTLTLAPNGMDALSIIGADEAVRKIGLPMNRTVVTDGYGEKITEFPHLPDVPAALGLWRDELCRVLHEQAAAQGVRIEYGKRLVDAKETSTDVTATFEDGSTATADVLIGADGIRSKIRRLIDPNAPHPDALPLLNFGAAADIAVPAQPDVMYFVFGKKAFFGYWVQPDGRTAWFANVPDKQQMTFREANKTSQEAWMQRLHEEFADDVPAPDVLQHTSAQNLCVIGSIETMPKLPHWYSRRMVLVGDAVHAPSPSSGQGASMAVESAIQLARCLRDIPDPQEAFAAYEKLRRERVQKVALRGTRTTNVKTMGPFAKKVMKLVMPVAMKTFLDPERTLGPEQRYHIDWDAPVPLVSLPDAGRGAPEVPMTSIDQPLHAESFPCTETADIQVHLPNGEVLVELADIDAVTATVYHSSAKPDPSAVSDSAPSVSINFTRNRLVVTAPRRSLTPLPLRILVRGRPGSTIQLTGRTVSLAVSGQAGSLTAEWHSGELSAEAVDGQCTLRADSGQIRLGASNGELDVRIGTADINIQRISGSGARLTTGRGTVSFGTVEADVSLTTEAGTITVADAAAGSLHVRTGAGSIHVGVRPGVAATAELSSGTGSIRNDLPVSAVRPSAAGSSESEVPLRITAETSHGDITVTPTG
jgi:2-polyprenyl-6-methoxyphenol hydroxylase-like FAD-dependent oxidoreductase